MFSMRNLKEYMYKCCTRTTHTTLNKLKELKSNGDIIDINEIFGRMTFDCFTSIAFGISFDSMKSYPKTHPFMYAFDYQVNTVSFRDSDAFWRIKKILNIGYNAELTRAAKVITEFSDNVVNQARKSKISNITDESGTKTFDLLSLYLDNDPNLSNEQLRYIALHFMIAGRDTTRMLLSWFFYDMSVYSDIKQKVLNEINSYNEITFDTVRNGFKYLEAVLCETLRYHPVVPWSVRVAKKDIIIPKGVFDNDKEYTIYKGNEMLIHHYTICKSTKFWKDPYKYDPQRFIKKGVRTYPEYVFTFFNFKPRLCLGRDFALMEAKIFIYYFFKTYNYNVINGQKMEHTPGLILNMKNGLKINISNINK